MEIIRHDRMVLVRIVNTIYFSNSYLFHFDGSKKAWLIDCGDMEPVERYLSEKGLSLQGVFLTHVHYDHIYGLKALKEKNAGLRVYTTEEGIKNLKEPRYNLSKYHGEEIRCGNEKIQKLCDGSEMELFDGHRIVVLTTPGHDWSGLTFKVENFLFTGDAYIPGLKTVTTFPKSNRKQAEESVLKIKCEITETMLICPGHGEMVKGSECL